MDLAEITTPSELFAANEAPPSETPNLNIAMEAFENLTPQETKALLLIILRELANLHVDVAEDEIEGNDPENALAWAKDERSLVIMWNILNNIEL